MGRFYLHFTSNEAYRQSATKRSEVEMFVDKFLQSLIYKYCSRTGLWTYPFFNPSP